MPKTPNLRAFSTNGVASGIADAGITTATGSFGATMAVELVNDGPVTFVFTVRGGKVVARSGPAPG